LTIFFQSLQQYDTLCNIGNWITATFANVANKSLIFSKMCLPKFEKADGQKYPKTRICKDGKLQVFFQFFKIFWVEGRVLRIFLSSWKWTWDLFKKIFN